MWKRCRETRQRDDGRTQRGNVTRTFPELFLPPPTCSSEWVVGRDSLFKSWTGTHHLNSATLYVSLTRPRTPPRKAAHSVSKVSWGRRVFVCSGHQSLKLVKRCRFWQVSHGEYLFNWTAHWTLCVLFLFVGTQAITSIPWLDCFCFPEAYFVPFWRWDPVQCRSSL